MLEKEQTLSPNSQEDNVTPQESNTAPPATEADADGSLPRAEAEVPQWTPDYKFKASGAEHEIPEMYRGLATDQKSLDEIKRLHEKAYGVDSLVQSRDSIKKQMADLQPRLQEYDNVNRNFEKLSHFVQNNDFDSFFQALQIPEKQIVKWIQQKISLAEAAPEVREQHERNRQLSQQQWEQGKELETYRSREQEHEQVQAFTHVADTVSQLAGDAAKSFDDRMGEGAFIDLVINKGIQLTAAMGGREPTLEQVIDLAKADLQKLGVFQAATPQAQVPNGTPPIKKPTIPIVPAGGQSPIKQPIKGMKDLLAAQAAFGD